MTSRPMIHTFQWLLLKLRGLRADSRGASAVEFAIILPVMMVLFFGTVELSNGVAVDRKVTLTARTVSDLISTAMTVSNTDMQNAWYAAQKIMAPYTGTTRAIVSEVKIDGNGKATISWSQASNTTARNAGDDVTSMIPTPLEVKNTYLIWGEASYTYTPVVGYVMKTALTLSDQFFSRPRQSLCVQYSNSGNAPYSPSSC